MLIVKKDYDKKSFTFDAIYPETASQQDVFDTSSKHIIDVNILCIYI